VAAAASGYVERAGMSVMRSAAIRDKALKARENVSNDHVMQINAVHLSGL